MARIRINKLALELNIQNDQILDELKKRDIVVKNHMSSIDIEVAEQIRDLFIEKPKSTSQKKSPAKTKSTTKSTTKPSERVVPKSARIIPKTTAKTAAKKKEETQEPSPQDKTQPSKADIKQATAPSRSTKKQVVRPKAANEKASPKTVKVDKAPSKQAGSTDTKPSPLDENKKPKTATQKTAKKLGLKVIKPDEVTDNAKATAAAQDPKDNSGTKKTSSFQKGKDSSTKDGKNKKETPPTLKESEKTDAPQGQPKDDQSQEEEQFELVQLTEDMSLRELSDKLNCTPNDLIKDLMIMGIMASINQNLGIDVSSKLADQRGFEVEVVTPVKDLGLDEEEDPDDPADRVSRSPIVTIMGHVDHGKTSLLDTIRKTSITENEHGGITQHIGAYQVKVKDQSITFLDTPGHEAFTAMRARGAQVTDIVVLVVAADDGIKPQTKEAISHSQAANVPILVAINKIDKADAKPDEVKKQLADLGLLPEDWGGQTIFTEVSALQGTGVDALLEMLLLQAEILELKSNPKVRAQGVVIESHLDKGRGAVATVIVEKGTLTIGDPFIVGNYFGKARSMLNDQGKAIQKAPPCTPIEVTGLPEAPAPGDRLIVVKDEKKARQLSSLRLQKDRESQLSQKPRITMEDLHQQIAEGKIQELNLIFKADVQGSIQAVQEAFSKLETDKVRIRSIHDSVGGITESDVLLASASNAIIIGFNVRPTEKAELLASKENVDVRLYSVIYDAINDTKKAMDGLLEPTFKEKITGRAEVREVFSIPKIGAIAGCHVTSGVMERNRKARLIRDSIVIYDGKIQSLRRFKEDVKEVPSGYECGVSFEKYQDIKQGDIIEPYLMEEITVSS